MIGNNASLNVHCFIHEDIKDLHVFRAWCREKGHNLTFTNFKKDYQMPEMDQVDWLIITGSPLSVNDDVYFDFIKEEQAFLKEAIARGKAVLGICFGAQMIAKVLGKPVYNNIVHEYGWHRIHMTQNARQSEIFSVLPEEFTALLLHSQTLDLPDEALHLASSEACANQAFIIDGRVIGLQFHLEMIADNLGPEDMPEGASGPYVQELEQIKGQAANFVYVNSLMFKLLDKIEDTVFPALDQGVPVEVVALPGGFWRRHKRPLSFREARKRPSRLR